MRKGRDQAPPAVAGDRGAEPLASSSEAVATKLVAALDRIARAQRKHRQASATRLGLTPLQAEILRTLNDGPPPEAVVGAVASELGVKQPTVTDSVAALERKGLVTRQRSEQDLRRITLHLTEDGREIVAALASADDEIVTAVAGLPAGEVTSTYVAVLGLIKRFVDTGYIDVARTCLTCRYMTEGPVGATAADVVDGSSASEAPLTGPAAGGPAGRATRGRHCTLLDMALPDPALRVNCAEHEAVSSQR